MCLLLNAVVEYELRSLTGWLAVDCRRVLVNGYGLNHTALSVHQIAGRQGDIYSFANELVMKGFKMNETGGIMKVTTGQTSADTGD